MRSGSSSLGQSPTASISKVKVNGPIYGQVVNGKDLVADILPPPEYIIESYLTAYEMAEPDRQDRRSPSWTRK